MGLNRTKIGLKYINDLFLSAYVIIGLNRTKIGLKYHS